MAVLATLFVLAVMIVFSGLVTCIFDWIFPQASSGWAVLLVSMMLFAAFSTLIYWRLQEADAEAMAFLSFAMMDVFALLCSLVIGPLTVFQTLKLLRK